MVASTGPQPLNLSSAPPVHNRRTGLPLIMTSPATLAMVGLLSPFAIAVYYSFTNYRIVSPTIKFVGLRNYARMFVDAEFWEALGTTLMFASAALVVELTLGFLIAVLLNRQVKGVGVMRAMLLLPLMLPPVISGMMWKTMLASSSGPVNYIFGLGTFAWFANVWSARLAIILIEVWSSTPFVALVLLSCLQSLPKEPFEAAQADGAGSWL